ncbi:endonuclease-like protein [Dehalogenimonas sp. WBC-2]|nr:endonuclease-like protein [Dehalogenimonas sp. WBC-2]
MNRISSGKQGELIAQKYLQQAGFSIIATNWRCEFAEVDIIALNKDEIVFFEVRSKSTKDFGTPAESITRRKRQKLICAAEQYLSENPEAPADWRIDFIGVEFLGSSHQLEHIPYAVTRDD